MTRGEEMLKLRRARMASAPPVLRGGFRPFFLGGAIWAILAVLLWLAMFSGALELPAAMAPLAWHRHEMLFGFTGAAIAGFLLTAVPNWTGRLPIAGWPLALLFLLWLSGRIGLLLSQAIGLPLAALLDVGFYVTLATVVGREIVAARNRNLPAALVVLGFGIADALDYGAAAGIVLDEGLGFRLGIALAIILVSLIGGRIIPSFTRNWLVQQGASEGLPVQPTRFDLASLLLTALALLGWAVHPEGAVCAAGLAAAGLLQLVRLSRWSGLRTVREPIVFVLHLGYVWTGVGMLLLALACIDDGVPRSAAIHALTAGAIGTMILAVMTRATRGHTGYPIKANALTVALYAAVTAGALMRVAASLGVADYATGVRLGGFVWLSAFVIFVIGYGPMLTQRHRVDPAR